MKNFLRYALWAVCFQPVWAFQLDSLENALKTAEGEKKVKVMNELFRKYVNSDPVRALGYSREALALASSINDQKGMAAAYNNLGVAYRNQGALDIALENYMKGLEIYTALQNGEGMASTKNNIANIYSSKKDYGQALKYFEESHNGFVAIGNAEKVVGSMNNLGNLHSDLQLYDQALKYYSDAWKLSEKAGGQFTDPLSNIGNLYYRQGNYQRAVEYYQRALDIVKKQNNRVSELAILANIGEVYVRANQPKQAQRYLDDALAMTIELQASLYLPQILKSMSSNYARQGKMKEAYETFLQYDAAREKIYGEESTRRIAQMDMAIDLREKEAEIEALEMDDQMKSLKLRNIQIIVTAIIMAIVLIVAFVNIALLRKRLLK